MEFVSIWSPVRFCNTGKILKIFETKATSVRKQPIIALYFESVTVLKLINSRSGS